MFEVLLDGTDAIGASAATAAPGGDAFEERTALLRRQSAGGRHDDPQSERRSTRTCRVVASQRDDQVAPHFAIRSTTVVVCLQGGWAAVGTASRHQGRTGDFRPVQTISIERAVVTAAYASPALTARQLRRACSPRGVDQEYILRIRVHMGSVRNFHCLRQ
jgi:hypothetical protein